MPLASSYDESVSQGWPADWRQCLADFLRHHDARSHNTYLAYRSTLTHFFLPLGKHPGEIVRSDIEEFLYHETVEGKRPAAATVNRRLAAIASFYDYSASFLVTGEREGERPHPLLQTPSPTIGMEYGQPAKVYRALSPQEITQFFTVIPHDTAEGLLYRALFWFYFVTGRRREELLRLRWKDLEYGMITDEQGNNHQGWVYRYFSKGHSQEEARAELPPSVKVAIDRYLIAAGRMEKMKPEDPLFVAPHGRRFQHIDGETVARALKKYALAAGLDVRRLSIHSWRHSMVQQRLAMKQPMLEVMKITGHQSLDSFYRYTLRLTGSADPGAKLLEERFGDLLS